MSVDSISRDLLAARAVGQFPLSIATSLAFESAFGILPEAPTDTPEIRNRDVVVVNIRTLFRNILGSVATEDKAKLSEYTIAECVSAEMRVIETLVSEHSDGRASAGFYHCSYKDIVSDFPRSIPRTANTPGQKIYQAMEGAVIKLIKTNVITTPPILWFNRKFPESKSKALMLSHYPVDLLQRYKFDALSLLESHTGAIKPPVLWNTKLHNGRELEVIPFDRMTLQLFGDGILFAPMPIKIRKRVYNIAIKKNWTPATTKDYVIHCIEQNRDPALEVLIKDLYRG